MQLASSILATTPMQASSAVEVVAPSRLFAIAGARIGAALRLVEGGAHLPGSGRAMLAVDHAVAGGRILESSLVPATPFHQRQAATSAIEHVSLAIAALLRYGAGVSGHGSGPIPRSEVGAATLRNLATARARLTSAGALIA